METQIYLFSRNTEDINIESDFCIKPQTMLKAKILISQVNPASHLYGIVCYGLLKGFKKSLTHGR